MFVDQLGSDCVLQEKDDLSLDYCGDDGNGRK